jgi:hypothetical protein
MTHEDAPAITRQSLEKDFPVTFGECNLGCVPEGWFGILHKLGVACEGKENFKFKYLEEKYARLEGCWMDAKTTPLTAAAYKEAQEASTRTCQQCGKRGRYVSAGYWDKIACFKCFPAEEDEEEGTEYTTTWVVVLIENGKYLSHSEHDSEAAAEGFHNRKVVEDETTIAYILRVEGIDVEITGKKPKGY